jgi:hypothetical protein
MGLYEGLRSRIERLWPFGTVGVDRAFVIGVATA